MGIKYLRPRCPPPVPLGPAFRPSCQGVPPSGLDRNCGNSNSLSYNIGLRILVCLHTPFSRSQLPHAPEARGLLLNHDLRHLVGAVLQVVTPAPAPAPPSRLRLLLLFLHPVEYLLIPGAESTRQRSTLFPRGVLGSGRKRGRSAGTIALGRLTRESVSRVARSCENRTDAVALTGPPSCSARGRHFQLPTCFCVGHRGVSACHHGPAGPHQVGTEPPRIGVVGVLDAFLVFYLLGERSNCCQGRSGVAMRERW